MPRELNVISQPGSSSGGDACTYMWACAICDENETCQKDKVTAAQTPTNLEKYPIRTPPLC